MVNTRFAPSPTGFLHIGGARTALFSWAYAKKNNGKFILRIEDTDLLRSTKESVTNILDAMSWLGLDYNEGPFYQTQRMDQYKAMIEKLLKNGQAYYCYCSKEELEEMREEQRKKGSKPKYDRRCLNNNIKKDGVAPVVRFKNPESGIVKWDDLVKGKIEISNEELDDFIIARSDGTPTYNFCVVIDDLDMNITHVIRGDDHVNNTPKQINLLQALGVDIPFYAHVPMILREDGQKMSKRTDAVSVMQYKDMGILPEALLNYLARLCWGHGDDEVFDMTQFIEWFDLKNVSNSPARFDIKKLLWVNSEHIKKKSSQELGDLIKDDLISRGLDLTNGPKLEQVVDLIKGRCDNLIGLANECEYIYRRLAIKSEDKDKFLTDDALTILFDFANGISKIEWTLDAIKIYIKDFCAENGLKMPQLGMPLRLKLCGTTQTPSFDLILYVLGKEEVLRRIGD
ncbi:MAG: glutamate--tRNA ligase [Neisseriaceae bacterium]